MSKSRSKLDRGEFQTNELAYQQRAGGGGGGEVNGDWWRRYVIRKFNFQCSFYCLEITCQKN
jgi:hypothetical protein